MSMPLALAALIAQGGQAATPAPPPPPPCSTAADRWVIKYRRRK